MPIVDELHKAIVDLSGPRGVYDSREAWLARGARQAGISKSLAHRIFYRLIADPKYSIVEKIRAATLRLEEQVGHDRIALDRRLEELAGEISEGAPCAFTDRRSGVDRRTWE